MLLLFETAAGFALFKVLKEGKLKETEVCLTCAAAKPVSETWCRRVRLGGVLCRTCTRTLSLWMRQRRCTPQLNVLRHV